MNREKSTHWTNTSEKLQKRSCISGEKTLKKNNHKSFPKASKGVFTIA